ncbi:TonB-dependent receptor plug domain-containing protein [Sphingomicrobium sp. XHP0239]|uniref:TonB-dependent receptor plug domain-containing protein n=1 Tax=Sphingomicrobium maritimum TaxID=3133972 RepID=UPI0031CC6C27
MAALLAGACPTASWAQEAGSEVASDVDAAAGARIYTYEDLALYAPQTALEMVRRIPGFQLEGGSQGRGLGQASQNVLINGQRITAKSNDVFDTLSRIDAQQVIRIEIVDAASLDVPGLTGEVANVVYEAGGISGTWRYFGILRERIDDNFLNGSVSLSGGSAAARWSLSLANNRSRQGNYGPELVFGPDGELLTRREEISRFNGDQPRVAGSYTRSLSNGDEMNVNGAFGLNISRNETLGTIARADGSGFDQRSLSSEDEWNAEMGGDYAFDLGDGRFKLIGLQRFEHSPTESLFGVVGLGDERFVRTVDESESIGRGEYGWKRGTTDWELAGEAAYNRLAATSLLVDEPLDGPGREIAFPDNNISELRGEAILSMSRPVAPAVSLQLNGGAEYSRITADGSDASGYFNPKGSANLNWRASDTVTVDARVERTVDQLNFFDFLATVDLQDDADRGRNNAIRPPTRWIGRLEAAVRLGEWGSVTPFVTAQQIDGVIQAIPIDADTEALGNAGDATRWTVGADGTWLLGPVGVEGARVDFDVSLGDSRFIDPLLGTPRALNGQTYSRISVNYRHDIPGSLIAYGGNFYTQDSEGSFRLDQFTNRFNSGPSVSAFVEHKNLWRGIQGSISVENILQSSDRFDRIAYVDRRDGPIAFTEFQDREFGRVVSFSLSGSI